MTSQQERRHTFPEDLWASLKYFTDDKKQSLPKDIQNLMKPEEVGWEILRAYLTLEKHYPPKYTDAGKEQLLKDLDVFAKEPSASVDVTGKILFPKEME
jgi:hypothetical protein